MRRLRHRSAGDEVASDGGPQFVFDERAALRPVPLPHPFVGPVDIRQEVANAEASRRTLDLLGAGLVLPAFRCEDGAAVARELAYEAGRDALTREVNGSAAGLVSLPTSVRATLPADIRHRSTRQALAASELLGRHVDAFTPDPDASRIARLRRAVGFSARVHLTDAPDLSRCIMVTLTYRGVHDWAPRHISDCLQYVRRWFRARELELRYVWVCELQKRGAPHYHLALWVPPGVELPYFDAVGWWPHGMSRVEVARGAVGYLMKYLSKGGRAEDHRLPGGARVFGVGGLGHYWRAMRRWLGLPAFVRARVAPAECRRWQRSEGGGWVDCHTGDWWPSEFRRVIVGCLSSLQRVLDHGRPFLPDGVYSPWASVGS